MFAVHHKKGVDDLIAQCGRKHVVHARVLLFSCIKRGQKRNDDRATTIIRF